VVVVIIVVVVVRHGVFPFRACRIIAPDCPAGNGYGDATPWQARTSPSMATTSQGDGTTHDAFPDIRAQLTAARSSARP
jgi:hypothetical protein